MSTSRPLLPRPEATGHDRLLVTLARHGRFAAAATLFPTARCTTRALNALLAALCSSSSPAFLRVAPSVLLRAAPHAAPDATTFRILTSALCRAQRPAAAADLLRCVPGLLLDPDPRHCRAVLASLCRCAPARDALPFLDDMRRWGVPPSRSDHHAVLDALLREGMAAEAYEVVAKQMDADGVAPGLPEFERVLRALRESGSFDAVEEAFDEMLLRGLVPGARVYGVYVGALCDKGDLAAGDVDAAREVAREAVRRGLRWDAPARGLLLDILRDGCASGLDASAFEHLMGGGRGSMPGGCCSGRKTGYMSAPQNRTDIYYNSVLCRRPI